LFGGEALELLARQTRGIPRLLNQAAHQALSLAAETGAAQVDAEAVLEALAMLGLAEQLEQPNTMPLREDLDGEEREQAEISERAEQTLDGIDALEGDQADAACRFILSSGSRVS
jgi:hypothetical protein